MNQSVPPVSPVERDSSTSYRFYLKGYVSEEMDATREENREQLRERSSSSLERDDDIGYIKTASVVSPLPGPVVVYSFQVHSDAHDDETVDIPGEFGVYPRNEVLVMGRINDEEFELEGSVSKVDDRRIVITFNKANTEEKIQRHEDILSGASDVSIGVLLNSKPFDREKEAVNEVFRDQSKKAIVLGKDDVSFDYGAASESNPLDLDLYDNERQKEGIERALAANQLACLQGPPGTGKTRVIIELARRFVEAGEKVLICAESNAALDNVLVGASDEDTLDERSLHYYQQNGNLRIARHNTQPRSVSRFVYEQYHDTEPARANVVVSTNNSAASLDEGYDVAIVDEATQATKPSTMIPMSKADTLILVGDHQQLPPVRLSEYEEGDTRHLSLFEHLYADEGVYGPDIGTRFNVQYRMNEKIAGFSSQMFYDGDLHNGREVPQLDGTGAIGIFDIVGSEEEGYPSKRNEAEAQFVMYQLRMLIQNENVPPREIGVAAAYGEQVECIKHHIRQSSIEGVRQVTVNTFDAFQGSERTAMVLSFTRANDRGNIGFLSEYIGRKRLNVALTRAKRYSALIGNWDTLRAGDDLYEELYNYVSEEYVPKEIPAEKLLSANRG